MLLHIVARGKIGRSPEAELVERYMKRIAWPTRVTELPDRGGTVPPLPPNSVTIALDERGKPLGSTELAAKLEAWRDDGKREAFDEQQAHVVTHGERLLTTEVTEATEKGR